MGRWTRRRQAGQLSDVDCRIAEMLIRNWNQFVRLSMEQPRSRQVCEALLARYAAQQQSTNL